MGDNWTPNNVTALRGFNPNTLSLTSVNAVEGPAGLPDHFYLHNISGPGSRFESWPGAFRLDLTKTDVAECGLRPSAFLSTRALVIIVQGFFAAAHHLPVHTCTGL